MFRHRQPLRRWAARVLFLWLFGMGAGIANSCITTAQVTPVAVAASQVTAMADAHHDGVAHHHAGAEVAGAPGHIANLSKANCQDFCEKATVSIPPLKSALDDGLSHAAIAMTALTVLPTPAYAPVQLRVPRREGALAPPIPIAFLRLVL